MRFKNTSDHIEAYIKAILDQSGIVELQRSQLADTFQVVPSQINYVIKTRIDDQAGDEFAGSSSFGSRFRRRSTSTSSKHATTGHTRGR